LNVRLLVTLWALALSSCGGWTGRLHARDVLAGVRAPRRAPPRESCGPLRVAARSPIDRAPYLQRVEPARARVRWTSREPTSERVVYYRAGDFDERRAGVRSARVEATGRFQRTAGFTQLQPGAVHCYELVSSTGETLYGPVPFRAAPAPGSEGPVDLVLIGDSGGGEHQSAVRAQLYALPADLVLHAGDLAYFEATLDRLEERYFGAYEALLRSVPVFPVLGDHDVRASGGAPWRSVFDLPGDGQRRGHYSFDWGPIHVAALNTSGDLAAQARWLEADLAASDAPWTIVLGHRPAYSSGWHGPDRGVRRHLLPVMEAAGVDLYLAGHDHDYERTVPIEGVTHVVSGGGGHSSRPVGAGSWTAASDSVLHVVHLRVTRDRIELTAVDAAGDVFDRHVLRADRGRATDSPRPRRRR